MNESRRFRERAGALLPAVLLLSACASTSLQRPPEDYRYVNERIGVALDLGTGWSAYKTREGAPPVFQPHLPPDKGPDDSPLLVGVDASQQAFVRLLFEPAGDLDAESYFTALYHATRSEVQARDAKLSRERDSVRWRYSVRTGVGWMTFYETIVVRNGLAFRLGMWTLDGLAPRYEAEFARVSETLLVATEEGWSAPWRGLDSVLEEGAFGHLAFADPQIGPGEPECRGRAANLLWGIETERGSMALFGSLHFGHPDFYPLAEPVEAAFAESESLVVEVDSSDPDFQRKMTALVEERGQYPPGRRIQDELSPRVYERLDAELAKIGLPTEQFAQLEPWTLAIVLTALKFQSMGYSGEAGVERYLLERAEGKSIVALETAEEQVAALDSLDGELFLAYTLLSLGTFETHTDEIIQAWRCGDDAALAHLLLDEGDAMLPGVAEVMDRIFDDRNREMADQLERLIDQGGRYFVVVGAGHLVGEEGIPALLAERGYAVERR